jgi:hypothetical protein
MRVASEYSSEAPHAADQGAHVERPVGGRSQDDPQRRIGGVEQRDALAGREDQAILCGGESRKTGEDPKCGGADERHVEISWLRP